jgi:hypothetical protein
MVGMVIDGNVGITGHALPLWPGV